LSEEFELSLFVLHALRHKIVVQLPEQNSLISSEIKLLAAQRVMKKLPGQSGNSEI